MPFFQPDRKPHIIHPSGHEVDVQATFNPDGKIRVDYFRITDDLHERFTFALSSCLLRKSEFGLEYYDCTYTAYGKVNVITLVFHVRKCLWWVG